MICSTGKHKFIHIRIPKCASTSISIHLMDYCDEKFRRLYKRDRNNQWVFPHMKYFQYKKLLDKNDLDINDYFVFTFVRNPYDLMVARWKPKSLKFGKFVARKDNKIKCVKNTALEQQLRFITTTGELNDPFGVNFIAKYERFDKELRRLNKRLGINFRNMPVTNKSVFLPGKEATFDEKTIEIINRRFADDFRRLGYDTR